MDSTAESAKEKWYKEGLRFECQGSGKCCTSRGEYGYVYLTLEDRRRMAQALGLRTSQFTRTYCTQTEGQWHLKDNPKSPDCIFLEDNKCSVYAGRPTQCRTWPFWPENMQAKNWRQDVAQFCPGVDRGRLYSAPEIDQIVEAQRQSEASLQGVRRDSLSFSLKVL